MNSENYWQRFVESGRIEDYLSYVEETRQEGEKKKKTPGGEHSYAGFVCSDRDGDKPDACG